MRIRDAQLLSKESVRIEKADRSLYEFHRWYKEGRLVIDPEWQRAHIWNRSRASKLIESFLMEIPVPVIYLAKGDEGKYEVIDGVQRLTGDPVLTQHLARHKDLRTTQAYFHVRESRMLRAAVRLDR